MLRPVADRCRQMAPSKKKAPSKAPVAMKAPVWHDGDVAVVSAKRRDFSKADLRLFRGLAILAEDTVVAWEENDVKDLTAFVTLVKVLEEDEGVAAWGKWVLATRDKIL